MSRSPASDICSVRGMGVAESDSTSTRKRSWRRRSFCLTPKRCSSSTIRSPRSFGRTVRGLREPVPRAAAALGVQVDQLAGERLRRPPGAQLHLLPLLAAELRERRVRRVGPYVAADLVELVARHEDPVAAAVLEL